MKGDRPSEKRGEAFSETFARVPRYKCRVGLLNAIQRKIEGGWRRLCASSFYAHKKSPSGTAPDGDYRDGSVNAEPLKQAVFRGFGLKSATENRLPDLAVDIILSYLFGKKEAVLAVSQLIKLSCCYTAFPPFWRPALCRRNRSP